MASKRRQSKTPNLEGLLGPLETSVMEFLWTRQSATVTELTELVNADRVAPLSYKTILTVCTRLNEKGVVDHQQEGRAFRYRPTMTRSEFVSDQATKAAGKMIDQFGELALSSFVDQVAGSAKQLKALQDLLDEASDS
jgi:predicted transcriptional regulator